MIMEAYEKAGHNTRNGHKVTAIERVDQSRPVFIRSHTLYHSLNVSDTRASQRNNTMSPPIIYRQGAAKLPYATAGIGPFAVKNIPYHLPKHTATHIASHKHRPQERNSPITHLLRQLPQAQFSEMMQPIAISQYLVPSEMQQFHEHCWFQPLVYSDDHSIVPMELPRHEIQTSPSSGASSTVLYQNYCQPVESPVRLRPASTTSIESYHSVSSSLASQQKTQSQSVFRPILEDACGKRTGQKSGISPTYTQSQTSSRSKEDTRSTGKSPLPQNLRGDPFRCAKVKTELCRHFNTDKGCSFGGKCNYAHGEHELKYTKLMDLERAGLVDIEVFRTHPCITWISTGACPFDQRCMCLHDPRVAGSHISWLPHAETLINSIGSRANVDRLYHQRLASVYSCSPIHGYVPAKKWKDDDNEIDDAWKHLYSFVCNKVRMSISHWPDRLTENYPIQYAEEYNKIHNILYDLSEMHMLEIVLKMRESRLGQSYAYLPTHLFCGELCMVLQSRHFQLLPINDQPTVDTYTLHEIKDHQILTEHASCCNAKQFIAYEIVFGPAGDPSVTPLSVWFDILPSHIIPCTNKQAKRHKRSRHRLKKIWKQNKDISSWVTHSVSQTNAHSKHIISTRIAPFYHYQPDDDSAFDLVSGILRQRLAMLKFMARNNDTSNSMRQIKLFLRAEEHRLKAIFVSLRRFWMTWSWPVMSLKESIDDNSDVPPVNAKYQFSTECKDNFQTEAFFGVDNEDLPEIILCEPKRLLAYLWKSFATNIELSGSKAIENAKNETTGIRYLYFSRLNRLPIFCDLSMGKGSSVNRQVDKNRVILFITICAQFLH